MTNFSDVRAPALKLSLDFLNGCRINRTREMLLTPPLKDRNFQMFGGGVICRKTTRLNPQGRVAPLGAFAWRSACLTHQTRQLKNM